MRPIKMSIREENIEKFERFAQFCKKCWNLRGSPSEFLTKIKGEFEEQDIKMFMIYLAEIMGKNLKEFNNTLNEYIFSIIGEDPSILFADLDLTNSSLVSGARKIIEMSKVNSFDSLPVGSEKSANSALNALIVVLMNENKSEMKKDILQFAQSPYFSILISSGRLFVPEKHKQAQILFKKNDPFCCPIYQLPITQLHLPMSLFSGFMMAQFYETNKYQNLFFIFAIVQQVIFNCWHIKFFLNDATSAAIYSSFLNFYMENPSYVLSFFLNSLPKDSDSRNFLKVNDIVPLSRLENSMDDSLYDSDFFDSLYQSFYINQRKSSNSSLNSNDEKENLLQYFYEEDHNPQNKMSYYNSDIICSQLPSGIFPTYESALDFLSAKPESINIDTLIDDSLRFPSFTSEIASIFMSKLIEKDYDTAVNLSNQILIRIDDINLVWILQQVFFPIMYALYECLNEIEDEYQFEVLFFLFITMYENCTKQGDEDIYFALKLFISKMDEPFHIFLENFLNNSNEVSVCERFLESEDKPMNRLINFLKKCKETNDIDIDEMMKYPYLFFSALLWGKKTIHPNSLKLIPLKFPNYEILKRYYILLSSCHKNNSESTSDSTNLIYTISISDCSFELITKFPPSNDSGIRMLIIRNLQQIAMPGTAIRNFQGIALSWRAWIKIFSIEKFVLILIETIFWANENYYDQIKSRKTFLFAERTLASVFLNPMKTNLCISPENQMVFNIEKKKFEKQKNKDKSYVTNINADKEFKSAIWTTLEFINNYQGFYSDGVGIASFVLLLIFSIENDWESEFKKVLDFCMKMLKDSSWKSLKYSFVTDLLFVSMPVLEIHDLIQIDMFDIDFLKINWNFALNFFYIQTEIKHLKEQKAFSQQ